jgi:hypothetical protein
MRELTEHRINPANDRLIIRVVDEAGAGGANHLYMVEGFNTETNPSCPFKQRYGKPSDHATILFQNGPIGEHGVNGITQEVLLAIVADRLRAFQAGPFACDDNQRALECVVQAMNILHARTLARMSRGVEGTHKA